MGRLSKAINLSLIDSQEEDSNFEVKYLNVCKLAVLHPASLVLPLLKSFFNYSQI